MSTTEPGFAGAIGRTYQDSTPSWPEPARAPARRAERRLRRAGRRRVRGPGLLRLRDRDAAHGPARRGRPALHQLPHDGDVLADPRGPADRARNPTRSAWASSPSGRPASRLPRLRHAACRQPRRDAASARLQHVRGRQVAPDADGRRHRRRPVRLTGRSSAASTAGTASTARWPTRGTRSCSTTTTPSTRRDRPGYHLTEDLVDQADRLRPRPAVVATPSGRSSFTSRFGAAHWPHHVPTAYIEKYRGRYDAAGTRSARTGWRARRSRASSRRAPSCTPQPWRAGRGTRSPRTSGASSLGCRRSTPASSTTPTPRSAGWWPTWRNWVQLDNTLIVLLSDNGASPEGGPVGAVNARKHLQYEPETLEENLSAIDRLGDETTYPHYPTGWAQASNTPLKWYKKDVHGGGVRDPLIVHWPAGIAERGGRCATSSTTSSTSRRPCSTCSAWRRRPMHGGVAQMPLHGTSLAYTFAEAGRADPQADPVLRAARGPGDLARRLEGGRAPREGRRLRAGPLGAVPPGSRLLRVPRPGRPTSRRSCAR